MNETTVAAVDAEAGIPEAEATAKAKDAGSVLSSIDSLIEKVNRLEAALAKLAKLLQGLKAMANTADDGK